MDTLSIAANIAQIVSVIWLIIFGSRTIFEAKKEAEKGSPFKIKFTPLLLVNVVLTLLVLFLSTSLWLILRNRQPNPLNQNITISGTWVRNDLFANDTWHLTQSGSTIIGTGTYTPNILGNTHINLTLSGNNTGSVIHIEEVEENSSCASNYTLILSSDGNSMTGTDSTLNSSGSANCANPTLNSVSFSRKTG